MGFVNDMLAEVNSSGPQTGLLSKLSNGERKRIRFYSKAENLLRIRVHSRFVSQDWDNNYIIVCPNQLWYKTNKKMFSQKHGCPYCGKDEPNKEGGQKTELRYAHLIWNDDDALIQTLIFPGNKQGLTNAILTEAVELLEADEDITGRICTISRSGEGMKSTYKAKFERESDFVLPEGIEFPETKEEQQKLMIEMILKEWTPELLEQGELQRRSTKKTGKQQRSSSDLADALTNRSNGKKPKIEEEEELEELEEYDEADMLLSGTGE